jgi:hypothetical protein
MLRVFSAGRGALPARATVDPRELASMARGSYAHGHIRDYVERGGSCREGQRRPESGVTLYQMAVYVARAFDLAM